MNTAITVLFLSLLLFSLDRAGVISGPKGSLERFLNNFGRVNFPQNARIDELREENVELLSKIKNQRELELENNALRSQLNTGEKLSQKLLLAKVLSGNINFLVIDKGKEDGVSGGETVIYKNILVGKVVSVSVNRARVELPTSQSSKIQAKTSNGSRGIIVGQAGAMLIDNVTLSESIQEKDLVFTARANSSEGEILPDFVIGEVERVFKSESALFQQAKVQSPLDFGNIQFVFLVL